MPYKIISTPISLAERFENAMFAANARHFHDYPDSFICRDDGYIMRNWGERIGLSTSPFYLSKLMDRLGDMSDRKIMDLGGFLGDAAAFFSLFFKQVLAVEIDETIIPFALTRQNFLAVQGLARLEHIYWTPGDYLSKTIRFTDHDVFYNYFDRFSDAYDTVLHLEKKVKKEAPNGSLLVFKGAGISESLIHTLKFREDLSFEDIHIFQKVPRSIWPATIALQLPLR